jgi:aspartyl-tRNA(Asn)/glutamyl-tRNA(Gln) amidotransferase subunit A
MYLNDIYTISVNLAGLPGISIPAGLDNTGKPIGLQIIGQYFDDTRVLNAANQFQTATDWHQRAPSGVEQ